MATIRIPKTPPSAYNPFRLASDLLKAHVSNLEKAVGKRPAASAATKMMTEGEAAAYIRQLSRELHYRTLLPEIAAAQTVGQRPTARPGAKPKAAAKAKARKKTQKAGKTGKRTTGAASMRRRRGSRGR
jgi:hypothetical protein